MLLGPPKERFLFAAVQDGYVLSITIYRYISISMYNIILHESFYKSTIKLLLTMYVYHGFPTKGLITIPF